jgi:hypothetical protein
VGPYASDASAPSPAIPAGRRATCPADADVLEALSARLPESRATGASARGDGRKPSELAARVLVVMVVATPPGWGPAARTPLTVSDSSGSMPASDLAPTFPGRSREHRP